ncbi:MAG TPA: 30S ribosomal protein S20 [Candidatus Kapabacteria bacterium]|jgi:small subunit ribosomal protein S20|nr:30S ribosomal protein S20 [Candidatus Kapabacteria bacterium]HPU23267.1 30S ribosomal protein S20 [Candidatus Kapabacteria bacterium]
MAHHKSALKRIRQSKKRRLYNRANKRQVKLAIRAVREAKTYEEALQLVNKAYSVLDKVAARGVIHKNKAANHKSAITKIANKLQAAAN